MIATKCPCGNPVRAKGQRSCKYCHSAYMRLWRKKLAKELARLRALERKINRQAGKI